MILKTVSLIIVVLGSVLATYVKTYTSYKEVLYVSNAKKKRELNEFFVLIGLKTEYFVNVSHAKGDIFKQLVKIHAKSVIQLINVKNMNLIK